MPPRSAAVPVRIPRQCHGTDGAYICRGFKKRTGCEALIPCRPCDDCDNIVPCNKCASCKKGRYCEKVDKCTKKGCKKCEVCKKGSTCDETGPCRDCDDCNSAGPCRKPGCDHCKEGADEQYPDFKECIRRSCKNCSACKMGAGCIMDSPCERCEGCKNFKKAASRQKGIEYKEEETVCERDDCVNCEACKAGKNCTKPCFGSPFCKQNGCQPGEGCKDVIKSYYNSQYWAKTGCEHGGRNWTDCTVTGCEGWVGTIDSSSDGETSKPATSTAGGKSKRGIKISEKEVEEERTRRDCDFKISKLFAPDPNKLTFSDPVNITTITRKCVVIATAESRPVADPAVPAPPSPAPSESSGREQEFSMAEEGPDEDQRGETAREAAQIAAADDNIVPGPGKRGCWGITKNKTHCALAPLKGTTLCRHHTDH